jgi:glycosyltransferase involved in cell wall biosynthesis
LIKPKIAVLIDWYLPGTKAGGPVRSVHSLLKLLSGIYDFYVITLNRDLGSNTPYPDIIPNELFHNEGISYYYFSPEKVHSARMLDLIREINPGLIYLNSFWSFRFSIDLVRLKSSGKIKAPVLLAPRGMLGKGALGLKPLKKRTFLAVAKLFGWYKHVTFHATQEQEKKDILREYPRAVILTAPNLNSASAAGNNSSKLPGEIRLFFLSRISEVKNLHYALEILKDVPPEFSVIYDIYGNNENHEYWNRCSHLIEKLPPNVKVSLKGELPFNEVQEVIGRYHALLLPTLNENYGHSIVESLLSGCPVIISDQTPWTDVQDHGAGYALPLQDKQAFLRAIMELAGQNDQDFSLRSKAAINYISEKINLQEILLQYKQMFHACIHH